LTNIVSFTFNRFIVRNEASILSSIAELFLARDEYNNSLSYFEIALIVSEKIEMRNLYIKMAKVYYLMKNTEMEKISLFKAVDLSKNQAGDLHSSEDVALLFETVAKFHLRTDSIKEALEYSQAALKIRKANMKETDPAVSRLIIFIGKCYYQKCNIIQAIEFYSDALELRSIALEEVHNALRMHEDNSNERNELGILLKVRCGEAAECQHILGLLHRERKDYEKSLRHFIGELEFKKLQFACDHIECASVLEDIGATQVMMENVAEARISFVKASEIKRYCHGETSVEYATSLNNIGTVDFHLERYDDAQKMYLLALNIRREKLGVEHFTVGQIQSNVGDVYFKTHRYTDAAIAYREAIRIFRSDGKSCSDITGAKCSHIAKCLCALADTYRNDGKWDLALETYTDSYQIYIKDARRGQRSLETASVLEGLGNVFVEKKDYEGAMTNFKVSYDTTVALLDEKHPLVAKRLENIARTFNLRNDFHEASRLFKSVLTSKRLRLGEDSVEVAITLENLARSLTREGLYEEAMSYCKEAMKIKAEKFGEESMELGIVEELVGDIYFITRKYDDALELFYKAQTKYRMELCTERVDLAGITRKIGDVLEKKGNNRLAIKMFEIARKLDEKNISDSPLDII